MTENRLTTLLAGRPAIFDGGYGWLLQERGLPAGEAAELWNLENRSAITELSVRLDRTGAVRRLEDIATARRRLNGNGNPVLVFEALFCALIP